MICHNRKTWRFLLCLILLFMLPLDGFAGQAASPYPDPAQVRALYEKVQRDPTVSQEDKIKNTIDSYLRLRYEGQRRMQSQDFAFLVGESGEAQTWLRKAQDKQEIELAIAAAYQ